MTTDAAGTIAVTVVWATPTVQEIVAVDVPAGAPAGLAIERSGLVGAYGLDQSKLDVAIFGRRATLATPLRAGDRVELTRPLAADPRDARRSRAGAASRAGPPRGKQRGG